MYTKARTMAWMMDAYSRVAERPYLNANFEHRDEEEVFYRLKKRVTDFYQSVQGLLSWGQVPVRQADFSITVSRVAQVMHHRGSGAAWGRIPSVPPG